MLAQQTFDWVTGNPNAVILLAGGFSVMLSAPKLGGALAEVIKARADAHRARTDLVAATQDALAKGMRDVLKELQPNGGSSLRDAVKRIEQRLDDGSAQFTILHKRLDAVEAGLGEMRGDHK